MSGKAEAYAVAGVRTAAVAAGIRYPDRLDLVLMELAAGTEVAAVFTRNAFCAAPVIVAREHLQRTPPRYLLVNTGNANAGTGAEGLAKARESCRLLGELTGIDASEILPFSTGVIGEPLPLAPIEAALPAALAGLQPDQWEAAATGIMTTDTRPKLCSRQLQVAGQTITVTGVAKGAGMIRPNMATMLAFVFTDAAIPRPLLQTLLRDCVEQSFNRITVDGDTSTNDACVLAATGAAGIRLNDDVAEFAQFQQLLMELFQNLAIGLIRDAEGASKFVTIDVQGGRSQDECLRVAYCVAESPLVKTAIFASDPNWGRILAAVGRAGIEDLDIDSVTIRLGDVRIVAAGSRDQDYSEAAGQRVMDEQDITITIDLQRGEFTETVWTSDLSHDYVRINAEYRT